VGRLTALLLGAAAVLVAAAVGYLIARPSDHASKAKAATATATAPPSLRVAHSRLGEILVDGQGRTLYLYVKDRGTKSTCEGRCAKVWPPAIVTGTPTAGSGVAAAKLTTTQRIDHSRQLVYNGHPLYRLSSDVRPGQISGEGFLGTWFVVSAAGNRIGKLRHVSAY
jgi:predicted lipoprotein with Yx(FWY)xxD motif